MMAAVDAQALPRPLHGPETGTARTGTPSPGAAGDLVSDLWPTDPRLGRDPGFAAPQATASAWSIAANVASSASMIEA